MTRDDRAIAYLPPSMKFRPDRRDSAPGICLNRNPSL